MNGQPELFTLFEKLNISFDYYEHPPAPTIDIAMQFWKDIDAGHCKNLFFRNHKGNRHYLVIIDHRKNLDIHSLEKALKQGKLSFASEKRMEKFLGLTPGSVSPLGLINDDQQHVHLFIDESLKDFEKISFHPNINTASVVIIFSDFIKIIQHFGNSFDYIKI